MDPLPPPFAFFLLLVSGWVNRHQQDVCVARTASCFRISRLRSGAVGWFQRHHVMKQGRVMLEFLFSVLAALRVFVCSRSDTALEVLALRQQVAVLKRQRPRPTLTRLDHFFWTTLRHLWPRWSDVLLIVKPETVVRWHRAGFRLYWRWRSCWWRIPNRSN